MSNAETNIDQVIIYEEPTSYSRNYVSRREMIKYLIKGYPKYIQNEDYKTQSLFIISQLGCICTDCNGTDSISECKIETYYFELKNVEIPEIHSTIYI